MVAFMVFISLLSSCTSHFNPRSSYYSFVLYTCRYFNSLQSECFPVCFHSNANMVISAPTGSGKTVIFELCILRLLSKFISKEGRFVHLKGTLKTVSLRCKDTAEYIIFDLQWMQKSVTIL